MTPGPSARTWGPTFWCQPITMYFLIGGWTKALPLKVYFYMWQKDVIDFTKSVCFLMEKMSKTHHFLYIIQPLLVIRQNRGWEQVAQHGWTEAPCRGRVWWQTSVSGYMEARMLATVTVLVPIRSFANWRFPRNFGFNDIQKWRTVLVVMAFPLKVCVTFIWERQEKVGVERQKKRKVGNNV